MKSQEIEKLKAGDRIRANKENSPLREILDIVRDPNGYVKFIEVRGTGSKGHTRGVIQRRSLIAGYFVEPTEPKQARLPSDAKLPTSSVGCPHCGKTVHFAISESPFEVGNVSSW